MNLLILILNSAVKEKKETKKENKVTCVESSVSGLLISVKVKQIKKTIVVVVDSLLISR